MAAATAARRAVASESCTGFDPLSLRSVRSISDAARDAFDFMDYEH
jgi:hypothetical protein